MNWWMLGCGAAVITEIYTLYLFGKEISKRKELEKQMTMLAVERNGVCAMLKTQNHMIDKLVEKIPNKEDEAA